MVVRLCCIVLCILYICSISRIIYKFVKFIIYIKKILNKLFKVSRLNFIEWILKNGFYLLFVMVIRLYIFL